MRGINPDEAVAYGAAMTGGMLNHEDDAEFVIIDVNSLTLGIETVGKLSTVVKTSLSVKEVVSNSIHLFHTTGL